VAGAGNINVFDPNTGAYLGQLSQPNGAPIAIKGLWDLEFGDGVPDSGKTNQLFFDAGPNHPGDSTGGLFGVIHAAGDQSGNGGGNSVGAAAAPAQHVQPALTQLQLQAVGQQTFDDAADVLSGTGIDWFFAQTKGKNQDQMDGTSGELIPSN
jgi:hypothetical protein